MFTVTKSGKGKDFKTYDLHKAIHAFTSNKYALTIWENNTLTGDSNIVITRIEYTKLGNLPIWKYLQTRGYK